MRLFPLSTSLVDLRLARVDTGTWVVVVRSIEPGGSLAAAQPETYRDLTFHEAVDVATAALASFTEAPASSS